MGFAVLESRIGAPGDALCRLYTIEDSLELVINERAMAFGEGEHPKHHLTDYHGFFATHVAPGNRVLDIGCGYGAVARSIAQSVPEADVTGIDIEPDNVAQARMAANPSNLTFVEGDATEAFPGGRLGRGGSLQRPRAYRRTRRLFWPRFVNASRPRPS